VVAVWSPVKLAKAQAVAAGGGGAAQKCHGACSVVVSAIRVECGWFS
jgi:hypothetical protein